MAKKLIVGALFGVVIGSVIGWFAFASVTAAIGTGSALAASICGARISLCD